MDPINIIAGLNLIATFGANVSGAKKGLRSVVGAAKDKPKTYLQNLPLVLATLTLIGLVLGIFQIRNIGIHSGELYFTINWSCCLYCIFMDSGLGL